MNIRTKANGNILEVDDPIGQMLIERGLADKAETPIEPPQEPPKGAAKKAAPKTSGKYKRRDLTSEK